MAFNLRWLRAIPRPKRFLYFFDVQTGTEVILRCLILNKFFGLYGILALLTGASVTFLQLSMFLYSIFCFGALIYLYRGIHQEKTLSVLVFSYIYFLDSLINFTYTFLFSFNWFLGVTGAAEIASLKQTIPVAPLPAGNTPPLVGTVANSTNSGGGLTDGVNTNPPPQAPITADASTLGGINTTVPLLFQPESGTSIIILSVLWVIRFYTCLIVFSYARRVVRESITSPADETPFEHRDGWKGQLGRFLVGINKGYWTGGKGWKDHISTGSKFRRSEDPDRSRAFGRRRGAGGRDDEEGRVGLLERTGTE